MKSYPTQAELRAAVDYNPETGIFTWRARPGLTKGERIFNLNFAGKKAGSLQLNGYAVIRINQRLLYSHRLAWIWMTGRPPAHSIDHIDGDPANNRFCNLREVSPSQNSQNAKRRRDNTSGFKGVWFNRDAKCYQARISFQRKIHHLGSFNCAREAHEAYARAAQKLHGEYARVD